MSTILNYVILTTTVLQIFVIINIQAEEIRWDLMHQDDYDIIPHRVEVKWYNTSYGHLDQCALVKFNRTYRRVLNASGTLYKEIRKDIKASIQLYKFLSNTSKFFPAAGTVNVCEEFYRNSLNAQYIAKKYSNVDSCPPKPGYYYGTYVDADVKRLPPFIPRGDYRINIEVFSGSDKLGIVDGYGSVVNAPKKIKALLTISFLYFSV